MKTALLAALAAPLAALAIVAPAPAQTGPAAAERLRDRALQDDVAWNIVEGLTTEVGQRMAGTEAEARARTWAVAKLKALGFRNVHVEDYRMPTWVRGSESAEIVAPFPQRLRITALGRSAATPEAGITAEVVGFTSLEDLRAARPETVRGKIVFLTHRMAATQDGSSYSFFGPVRREAPAVASTKGAAAIVIRSIGTDHNRDPHAGGMNKWKDGETPLPAGALSVPDAENLERMLARGRPVTMKLVLTPRWLGEQVSGNVVAEVPGTDPAAGIVLIGGHLDSWDLGTGAIDDGTGVAITAAAAKQIMDSGKPRRTIRVVWFGSEEVGTYGSTAYWDRHKGENIVFVAESDFGADRVWQADSSLAVANKEIWERTGSLLAPLGIATGKGSATGGADMCIWVESGVAVIDLNQDGTRYFDYHHTPNDTLDKVDPVQLRQNVAAWTTMLSVVANSEDRIVRMPSRLAPGFKAGDKCPSDPPATPTPVR